MNTLWGWMMIAGVGYGMLTGNLTTVTEAVLDSAKAAVNLAITMAGLMAFWSGLMQVGQSSGIIETATRAIRPFLDWLFPDIPKGHPARDAIAVNCIANIFGLGWAATPAGLKAMENLTELERARGNRAYLTENGVRLASNEMCTFLVLNISSLQLIPVNIIAYRSEYGSINPAGIIGPAIAATMISTLAGIIFCKLMNRH